MSGSTGSEAMSAEITLCGLSVNDAFDLAADIATVDGVNTEGATKANDVEAVMKSHSETPTAAGAAATATAQVELVVTSRALVVGMAFAEGLPTEGI